MRGLLARTFPSADTARLVWRALWPALLGALLLLAYLPALQVYFLSDDYVLLTEAQLRRSFAEAFAVDPNWFFYRPLGKLLWLVEFRLFGMHAGLYHALSLAIHAFNSLLVMLLARRYLARWPALFAGLLFAAWPVHTEAVVWLACQYDLLATAGFLAALICLDRFWSGRNLWALLLALGAFQLSLWSKEIAFTLPLVAGSLALLRPARPRIRAILLTLAPFAVLIAVNLAQRYLAWGSFGGYSGVQLDVGALPRTFFATSTAMLAPLNQLVFPGWLVRAWALVVVLALVLGVLLLRDRRVVIVALAWLAITLVPVLGLLPPGADMQNSRVLYLPAVGLCLWLAAALGALPRERYRLTVGLVLGAACVAALPAQLGSWSVAGQNSLHVAQELHRLMPGFPPGSTVTAVGLPDNYRGAYIYRLGLNHSFAHHFDATFALDQAASLPQPTYSLEGDSVQVAFAFDRSAKHWQISQARRVTHDSLETLHELADPYVWDLRSCSEEWQFFGACTVGQGAGGALESPQLSDIAVGWNEVIVVLRAPDGISGGQLALQWRADSGSWVASDAARFDLPADRSLRAYHFYLGPGDGGQPLSQVRLELFGAADASIQAVGVHQIP